MSTGTTTISRGQNRHRPASVLSIRSGACDRGRPSQMARMAMAMANAANTRAATASPLSNAELWTCRCQMSKPATWRHRLGPWWPSPCPVL